MEITEPGYYHLTIKSVVESVYQIIGLLSLDGTIIFPSEVSHLFF